MHCPRCGYEIEYQGGAQSGARVGDPFTSHQAAAEAEGSGLAASARAFCLAAVEARPGLTAGEYARDHHVERTVFGRRLPELRSDGKIKNGPVRECEVTGRASMTWWPVLGQIELGV